MPINTASMTTKFQQAAQLAVSTTHRPQGPRGESSSLPAKARDGVLHHHQDRPSSPAPADRAVRRLRGDHERRLRLPRSARRWVLLLNHQNSKLPVYFFVSWRLISSMVEFWDANRRIIWVCLDDAVPVIGYGGLNPNRPACIGERCPVRGDPYSRPRPYGGIPYHRGTPAQPPNGENPRP